MNPANFDNLAALREANVSNCDLYIAHEVNGKVYNNRSIVLKELSALQALSRAKQLGLVAPVVSAVIIYPQDKAPRAAIADLQRVEERQRFNRNYKPVTTSYEEQDTQWHTNY